jgi:hypothetical protein
VRHAQSRSLLSAGEHGLPPGRTLGERFEEAAGLGDARAAAGGLGQEGGEGRGQGTSELGRAGPFAEDGREGGLPASQGGLPPLLGGAPPRAAERSLTLNCKEQHGPQGPEVGWGAGGVASDLLGGEERGRAPVGAGGGAEGGQADAGEAGVAVGGDQDVCRAEVEVGQTGGVGCPEGVEQLQAHAGHLADREGAVPGDQLVEG